MTDRPAPKRDLPPKILDDDIPESVMNELLVAFADGAGTKPATPPAPKTPTPKTPAPKTPAPKTPTPTPMSTPMSTAGADDTPTDAPERPDALTPTSPAAPVVAAAHTPRNPTTPTRDESLVVIEADDLPDAVVLDGDPSTGAAAVFDGEATGKRPKVDPRFRARRIAVRRAAGRKRLRWFVVAGAALAVVVAVLAVLASPLFAIDTIDVEGNVYADPAAIAAVVDSLDGKPILTADLDAAADELEAIPWVAAARVTMHFPHRVSIQIAERTPVASFQGPDGSFRVIDGDAIVVAVLPNAPVNYPPIIGILPNTPAGSDAGTAVRGASQLISALPPSLGDRLSSVSLGPSGELGLSLGGVDGGPPLEIVFGAANDYREKLIAVLNEMTRDPERVPTKIDVSTGSPITQ